MESEQGRSCQPSSAPGLWSQSSSLIYSQGSRGLWCSRTLQNGHQEANETAPVPGFHQGHASYLCRSLGAA